MRTLCRDHSEPAQVFVLIEPGEEAAVGHEEQHKESREVRIPKHVVAIYEWLDSVLFGLFVVMLLLVFVFKTYTVEGTSMEPNYHTGNYVFAISFLYTPRPGDVVVIDNTSNYGKPLIKRVVATGGQTVQILDDGTILVDGEIFAYDGKNPGNIIGDQQYPLTVPEGFVFVMGDNRGLSLDSRFRQLSVIDERSIVGRVLFSFN